MLVKCPKFMTMDPQKRREVLLTLQLCLKCFWSGHQARNCTAKGSCKECSLPHHTLLHGSKAVRPDDQGKLHLTMDEGAIAKLLIESDDESEGDAEENGAIHMITDAYGLHATPAEGL